MDQVKIGKFIQDLRKKQKLTQKDLAHKLDISDKTVSKWETGRGMPDLVFLKPLSEILGVTVNELLSGEKIKPENIFKKAEENLCNTISYSHLEMKKYKAGTLFIILGSTLLLFSILFILPKGLNFWFSFLSLLLISIGIYQLCRKFKKTMAFLSLVFSILLLLLMDYRNVQKGKEPHFAYLMETQNTTVIYKTPFYHVYKCNKETKDEYYEIDFTKEKEACTHPFDPHQSDIEKLIKYKSKYLGNNSNTVGLYNHLPLSSYGFSTTLDSQNLGIQIRYHHSIQYIEEDKKDPFFIEKSLLYNAVSTFLLIDNVKYIQYSFDEITYTIQKEEVLSRYNGYNKIIKNKEIQKDIFQKYVTEKVRDEDFVSTFFSLLFQEK